MGVIAIAVARLLVLYAAVTPNALVVRVERVRSAHTWLAYVAFPTIQSEWKLCSDT